MQVRDFHRNGSFWNDTCPLLVLGLWRASPTAASCWARLQSGCQYLTLSWLSFVSPTCCTPPFSPLAFVLLGLIFCHSNLFLLELPPPQSHALFLSAKAALLPWALLGLCLAAPVVESSPCSIHGPSSVSWPLGYVCIWFSFKSDNRRPGWCLYRALVQNHLWKLVILSVRSALWRAQPPTQFTLWIIRCHRERTYLDLPWMVSFT